MLIHCYLRYCFILSCSNIELHIELQQASTDEQANNGGAAAGDNVGEGSSSEGATAKGSKGAVHEAPAKKRISNFAFTNDNSKHTHPPAPLTMTPEAAAGLLASSFQISPPKGSSNARTASRVPKELQFLLATPALSGGVLQKFLAW